MQSIINSNFLDYGHLQRKTKAFIQNYSVYLKHFKRNKFDVRNAYFMRKAFLARNAFYTQIAFYACNAFNTCNASFQIGVPFWSSSHIFSVFRTTNYAHVRGTLQVTHTSGTVGHTSGTVGI